MAMAARKRRKSTKKKAAKCKVVTVNGRRRKLCWSAKGKLTSNRKA
jgi:hypothetical protein